MPSEDVEQLLGPEIVKGLRSVVSKAFSRVSSAEAHEMLEGIMLAQLASIIAARSDEREARRRAISCADELEDAVTRALAAQANAAPN